MKHDLTGFTGILGTVVSFSLAQTNAILSLLCAVCTLIVVAPKAYATVKAVLVKNESPDQNNR